MTTTVTYVHADTCEECEIEVSMGYDPPDPSVGIMSGGFIDHEFPDACPCCGHVYTAVERRKIERWAEEQVRDAADDYDGPDTLAERD